MSDHNLGEEHIPRTIGIVSLTMIGITCMIGSGWLFGAYNAAKLAGPASIFSWIIGGIIVLLVALTIMELSTMFPHSGGMSRYMYYSHGSLAGFISGWANWIAIVTAIPAEAMASTQYLSSWQWRWCQQLFDTHTNSLSSSGLIAATILTLFYFIFNYSAVKLFTRIIVSITIVKIAVPILTVITLFTMSYHPANFTASTHGFVPQGWSAVFTAVVTCGIVFSFNGFQSIANYAAEVKKPQFTIPIAIFASIIFTLILYVILQIVFIGALPTSLLQSGTWQTLEFSSPFAELAITLNLNLLLLTLYADAFLSPSATGITYLGSTARMVYGMQKHGCLPAFLGQLDSRKYIPVNALWVNLIICLAFLFIYRSWGDLAAVISVATIISYLAGPIVVIALRRVVPQLKRPVALPAISILAPITFVTISLLLYWARWPLTGQILIALAFGLLIYFYYQSKLSMKNLWPHLKAALWFIFYLNSIAIISYLGDPSFGGIGILSGGWDQVVVIIVAYLYYLWGIQSAWITPELCKLIQER